MEICSSGAQIRTRKALIGKARAIGASADWADDRLHIQFFHGAAYPVDQLHMWLDLLLHIEVGIPNLNPYCTLSVFLIQERRDLAHLLFFFSNFSMS